MKIKKHMPKAVSGMLCLAMVFGSLFQAAATDTVVTETPLEEAIQMDSKDIVLGNDIPEATDGTELFSINDDIDILADETRYETIEVTYNQASNYLVTIPKTISLGADRNSSYPIKVEGDIAANKQVCVVPVDGIEDTEVFDFYMSDQIAGSTKEDVVAEINQNKFYWNHEEVADGYEETDNHIVADGLSAGRWKGTFQMEISMRTDPAHIHNYVGETTKEPTCTEAGEKTYTCDCGDSYTENVDPTGHHYEDGECVDCHEKDPNHEHNYTETVTKEPTCTEAGEKTYTCGCGDSYTEDIPATGHHFGEEDKCTDCGELDPDHKHDYVDGVCIGCGIHENHTFVGGVCSCGEKDMTYVPEIQILATQKRTTGQWYNVSALSDLETIMRGLEENGVVEVKWNTTRSDASAEFKTKNVYVGILARLADTWFHVYHKNAATVTLNGKPLAFSVRSGSTASGEYVNNSNYGYYRYDITLPDSTSGSETFEMVTTAANGNAVKLNGTVSWPKNANTITIKVTACEIIYAEE